MNELLIFFIIVMGFNVLMFIPAFIKKTDKLTDISYALSFIALILFAYIRSERTWPHTLLTLMVLWWAVRLGSFLLMRVRHKGKDARFDGMREKFFAFLRFWILQGATVFVVLLAGLLYLRESFPITTIVSVAGFMIFAAGLYIESEADMQKWNFSLDPKNKGKWIESGIWGKSRHPNYLGEMMVWSGIYLYVLPTLAVGKLWLEALLSPLYIITLLLFVSGIPLLEKSSDKKWGKDKKYQEYKKRVPVLIPKIK